MQSTNSSPGGGLAKGGSKRWRSQSAGMYQAFPHGTAADQAAQQAIRALFDGPAVPAEIDPELLGDWAETVRLLREAYLETGVEGAERTFYALTHLNRPLISLMYGHDQTSRVNWTVKELYDADFPPPRMIVDDLLPAGLAILAGRPKLGKSWLALQIATAVSTGGSVFGLPARRGRVLFLALEDSPRRLRDRLEKQDVPQDADITFATAWAPLGSDGLPDLMLAAAKGYTLIIVDTLSRVAGGADQMDVADMTAFMSDLQRLAHQYDLSLLLVDHHRKPGIASNADPVDDIFGSTAKAGVVDVALGLYKQRGETEAMLKVTGRDLDEREVTVCWDANQFSWTHRDSTAKPAHTERQTEILDALGKLHKAKLRDLVVETGQARGNLFRRLQSLTQCGAVKRLSEGGHVYYTLVK